MHLVKDVLYLMVASTLATFEIYPLKDESGVARNVEITFDSGVVVYVDWQISLGFPANFLSSLPGHFDSVIRPRSSAAERLTKGLSD